MTYELTAASAATTRALWGVVASGRWQLTVRDGAFAATPYLLESF